jgi:EAL domain-containing protein (putative c-di-GMP-specific phosphodiesterase class I)
VLRSDVLNDILEGIQKYQLKEGSIYIELTESGFLESNSYFINFCEGLKANGIPLALDDFGTGYSNFHYLYNLNPSTIKIDRSFTLKALKSSYEYSLLRHMVDMTHDIDLKLCIEGIETIQELNKISIRCSCNARESSLLSPSFIVTFSTGSSSCSYPSFKSSWNS